MPAYCYSRDGEVIERVYPMGKAPEKIRHEGKTFCRDFRAEHIGTRPPGNWPLESDAMGVEVDQVAEAESHSREIGIPTHFNPQTGAAIFESPGHRKRYCEAFGYIDRNGGYSDPQPK